MLELLKTHQLSLPFSSAHIKKKFVDHSYTNFAMLDEDTLLCLNSEKANNSTSKKRVRDNEYERHGINLNLTTKKHKIEDAPFLTQSTKEDDPEVTLKQLVTKYGKNLKCRHSVHKTFPYKLMKVLHQENTGDIITWMPHGRAFMVIDNEKFVQKILCMVFEMTLLTSFIRQLNIWGFKRITQGRDAGAYYHELFLRGRPHLIKFMHRQERKGTGARLLCNPKEEPKFYDMVALEPVTSHNNVTSVLFNQSGTFDHSSNIHSNASCPMASASQVQGISIKSFMNHELSRNHPQTSIPLLISTRRLLDVQNFSHTALLNQNSLFHLYQYFLNQNLFEYFASERNGTNQAFHQNIF